MRRFVGRDSDTFFFRIAVSDNSYSSSQSKHTCLPSLARCKWNSHALGCPQLGQSTAGAPQGSPLSGSKPNCSSTWHRSFSVATVNSHRSSVILLHFPHFVDHRLWVVLGVPRSLGELKRRLTQAVIECFTDTDIGSLYYAVRQLAEFGLLTAVGHQRVARGGLRTVYRITPRGRDDFVNYCMPTLPPKATLERLFTAPCSSSISPIST